MKSIAKKWMQRMALTAMSLIVASAAQAITSDEALSLLPAEDLAALRAAPPAVVDALSDASQIASAWKAGRLPMRDAELAAADAVTRLTAGWSELATSPFSTRWAAHQVAVLVLTSDVKELMVASEWRTDGPLAEAVVGWVDESTRVRPLLDDGDPRRGCLERLADCFVDCSERETFFARGLCGLRCAGALPGCAASAITDLMSGLQSAGRGATAFR